MKFRAVWKFAVLLSVLSLCAAAWATMVPRFSLEELTGQSELIVHGRVLRTWSAWDPATQIIWTHSEIQVLDPVKGAPPATVVVSEPGGEVDGMSMPIIGMPKYAVGEETVLFLFQTPVGFWRARGLQQGKFTVQTEAASGVQTIQPASGAALVVEPIGGKAQPGTDVRQLRGMRLNDFKSKLRSMASQPGKAVN